MSALSRVFGGLLALVVACGCAPDDGIARGDGGIAAQLGPPQPEVVSAEPDPAVTGATPAERFYAAYLAETVQGDRAAARAGYEAVLEAAGAEDLELAARASLRLATLHALEGRRREALDLVARATSLSGDDPELLEAADALRLRLASGGGDGDDLRGPPAGTPLEGVSAEAQARFKRAERLLVDYLALRVRPKLENFYEVVRRKENALENAARAYRQVVELGDPVASAAAELRIASLYHDYALATLAFQVPPELTREYAFQTRRELRRNAARYFRLAQAAYAASLANAEDAPGADLWHAAARAGARAVDDILRLAP